MSALTRNKRPLGYSKDPDTISRRTSSKKPRFDTRNPSTLASNGGDEFVEDPILELDEIGKGGSQLKRNAVRLEGYDSDSSVENSDPRTSLKPRSRNKVETNLKKDEADDDMFAEVDEDDVRDQEGEEDVQHRTTTGKAKSVRFLEDNEIEGQVSSSKSGGHVSSDFSLGSKSATAGTEDEDDDDDSSGSSDTTVDDEERAKIDGGMDKELGAGSKKRHAPKLEAFNMRDEAKEGRFDENGNFVRNATDPYAVYDSWLEHSSKSEMRKAKEAHMKREESRREKSLIDDSVPVRDTLASLIVNLERGETAIEALGRLNDSKTKKRQNWQRNKRKGEDEGSKDVQMSEDHQDSTNAKRKEIVEAITASADRLLTRGQADVYDLERETLIRQFSQETGEYWRDELRKGFSEEYEQSSLWEFRWTDDRDDGKIHGPYDEQTMKAWSTSGFFVDGVEFRTNHTRQWTRQVPFV